MKWQQQISEDVQYILHNFTDLKITCIMLGGSCSWGCANPRDIDYIIYCSNITQNVHRHKKTEGNLGIHMIFVPNNNRYIKGSYQSWQIAEMYMALMQTNTELVLYGQPPDTHCPVDLITSAKEYMLQDISQCIDSNHIAKHCYIYLMWYYAKQKQCINQAQQQELQAWHDLHFTINDLQTLYNKIQRLSLC